jgi:amidohydrolase
MSHRRFFSAGAACGCLLAALAFAGPWTDAVRAEDPAAWATKELDSLIELYRHFHAHPELSLHEEQTGERVALELRAAGCVVTNHVGGHGVVGVLANGAGPTLMIRSDLDALPVVEDTGLVFASKVRVVNDSGAEVGVMHACGHDVHMTCLIGTARYLAANKHGWSGTAVFLGQPAEERGLGAKQMLDDGLFTRFPKPDFALALHVDANTHAGKVGYRAGYALANVDSVDIELTGRGGHGAFPHTTVDPVVLAAYLIVDLQTIVAREIDPLDSAVVTVGSIHGGSKHNIIGETCHLQLTIRSYKESTRQHLIDAIRRKAKAVAESFRAPPPKIALSDHTPATFNDEKLVARVVPALQRALGNECVQPTEPSMGGEDFSQYGLAGVPIFMFKLGAVEQERLDQYKARGQSPPSLHSPVFYPDAEPTIHTGVTAMSAAALDLLAPKKP